MTEHLRKNLNVTDVDKGEVGGGDPNSQRIIFVGLIGALLTFLLIVGVQGLFYYSQEQRLQRINRAEYSSVVNLRAEQIGHLTADPGWVDETNGVAHIPIDRAMELTARQLASDQQQAKGAEE